MYCYEFLSSQFRHFFKKDSSRNVSNEDRYAVSISGDIHGNVEANGGAEKSVDVSPCDQPTATLPAPTTTAAVGNDSQGTDVKPIPADAPSIVHA